MTVYLLGGPYHGDVVAIKHGTSLMREVDAKTGQGIIKFMCYYDSIGKLDVENRLVYRYNPNKARFISFVLAEHIKESHREILVQINQQFGSRTIPIETKLRILEIEDKTILQGIIDGMVGACKVLIKTIATKGKDKQYIYISYEDAKIIKSRFENGTTR